MNDELKRMGVRKAVVELRARMNVGQETLAEELARERHGAATNRNRVSGWERGTEIPSPAYRAALAMLAEQRGWQDLAIVFRGTREAWEFAGVIFPLMLKDDVDRKET